MLPSSHVHRHLLSGENPAGVLILEEVVDGVTVCDVLKNKHPTAQPETSDILLPLHKQASDIHLVLLDWINSDLIIGHQQSKSNALPILLEWMQQCGFASVLLFMEPPRTCATLYIIICNRQMHLLLNH